MARKRARQQEAPAAAMQPAEMRAHEAPARTDGRTAVLFTRQHTHAGIEYQPGDGYFATRQERNLLLHFDVIEVA